MVARLSAAERLAAELDAWNAAQQRARAAYESGTSAPVKPKCGCGKRTYHRSGLCAGCRT